MKNECKMGKSAQTCITRWLLRANCCYLMRILTLICTYLFPCCIYRWIFFRRSYGQRAYIIHRVH